MKASLNALASTILVLGVSSAIAQLPPNAPEDRPHAVTARQMSEHEKTIAPYIKTARATYPAARTRFLAGLPPRNQFFVVTRLVDSSGHWEQVFVRVTTIDGETITGIISSDIRLVSGFKAGQSYAFTEPALIDWLITRPDGSEEGNVVGKFLDTQKR
jgi:uncharacterized protein YegJ (DUF2314 family)